MPYSKYDSLQNWLTSCCVNRPILNIGTFSNSLIRPTSPPLTAPYTKIDSIGNLPNNYGTGGATKAKRGLGQENRITADTIG